MTNNIKKAMYTEHHSLQKPNSTYHKRGSSALDPAPPSVDFEILITASDALLAMVHCAAS